MQTQVLIVLARKHCDEGSAPSARACLADAVGQNDAGNDAGARMWAIKSLAHSLGVFHPEYKRAARLRAGLPQYTEAGRGVS